MNMPGPETVLAREFPVIRSIGRAVLNTSKYFDFEGSFKRTEVIKIAQ